jgi:ATP-binding cassette subfamily B protein AbcA/BmrA
MQRQKFNFRAFFGLINQLHPQYAKLVVGVLLGFVSTAANLFVPQMAQRLINNFRNVSPTLATLMVVIFIAGLITSAISGVLLGIFGENVVAKLRKRLWQKLLKLPVKYFDNVKTGEISSRLVNDTSQVKDLLASTFPNAMTSILQFVGALIIMLAMDWRMTLLMFVTVPLIILVMMPIMNWSRKIGRVRQDELAKFASDSTDVLGEVRLVKSSNGEHHELARGNQRIDNLYGIGAKEAIINSVTLPVTNMLMTVMFLLVLGYGAIRVMNGQITMGALVSFLMYLFQIFSPVIIVSQLFTDMAKTSGATERIQQMLAEPEEFIGDESGQEIEAKPLKFDHVDFAYEPDKPILKDVSFTTKPNAVIAFAGPSGGGKSTIFSLIERFYQPSAGKILLGDEDVDQFDLARWREQIGLVSQDAAVMPGTIRDNLTYGLRRPVSDDELWHALKMAYADGFVAQMADQLETEIGERGIKLSGGQRQRIAIARAFLRDPKILMLDEATASLDAESEAMVQKALGDLMQGRTTLVIAHRLSTIVDADKIYFIEHGTVSGAGTHQELLESTPLYAQYVHDQFK